MTGRGKTAWRQNRYRKKEDEHTGWEEISRRNKRRQGVEINWGHWSAIGKDPPATAGAMESQVAKFPSLNLRLQELLDGWKFVRLTPSYFVWEKAIDADNREKDRAQYRKVGGGSSSTSTAPIMNNTRLKVRLRLQMGMSSHSRNENAKSRCRSTRSEFIISERDAAQARAQIWRENVLARIWFVKRDLFRRSPITLAEHNASLLYSAVAYITNRPSTFPYYCMDIPILASFRSQRWPQAGTSHHYILDSAHLCTSTSAVHLSTVIRNGLTLYVPFRRSFNVPISCPTSGPKSSCSSFSSFSSCSKSFLHIVSSPKKWWSRRRDIRGIFSQVWNNRTRSAHTAIPHDKNFLPELEKVSK